jgi:5-methyltetrahydropteroyltriglutamate--homocysteine methyltransferase
VPKGKTVALGLVTTKSPALESPDALKRRLVEAAGHVGLGQLCLCPQCGFASGFGAAGMTEDQERAKLDLLVRVAREVWGD